MRRLCSQDRKDLSFERFSQLVGIIQLLQFIPIKEFVGTPVISMEVVAATVVILGLIGLAAGLMPARKAANLDVVECLRT